MDTKSVHTALFALAGSPGCTPEYQLAQNDIETLAKRMVGIPVTYDHRGIHDAIQLIEEADVPLTKPNVLRGLVRAAETDPKQRPIGIVQDAWVDAAGNGMCTFFVQGSAAKAMIEAGNLGAVSLTHIANSMQPLELSICNIPARPGSNVVFKSIAGPQQAAAYKAYTLQPHQNVPNVVQAMPETRSAAAAAAESTPVVAAAAAASEKELVKAAAPMTLQQALALLPEEARATLADKFTAQAADLTKASAELDAAKSKLKVTEEFNKTECALLTEQLNLLLAQMPEDLRKMYSPNVPKLVDSFASGDPRACMDAAFRTVTCASRALQLRQPTAEFEAKPPAAKRMRNTETGRATATMETTVDQSAPPADDAAPDPVIVTAAAPAPSAPKPTAGRTMSNLERLNAALGLAFD